MRTEAARGVVLAGLLAAAPAFGQEAPPAAPPGESAWEFSIAPYLWGAGLEGTITDRGMQAEFDVSFGDLFDALDFGAFVAFEARHDKLFLASNLFYLDFSPETGRATGSVLPNAPAGDLDVGADLQQLLLEGLVGYQVAELGSAGDSARVAFDAMGGLRYVWMRSDIRVELDPGSPLGPFRRHAHETDGYVDLLVGARARFVVTDKLRLMTAGSAGGFGIGSSSHLSWSVLVAATYQIGEHWSLAAGWRRLDIERGVADTKMAGPLLGGVYTF